MITSLAIDNDNVSGRLGNKLFQIACMIGYSQTHEQDIILPYWQWATEFPKLNTSDKARIIINGHYQEPHFHYRQIPWRKDITILNIQGYFQSEKYFAHCKNKVREILTPNEEVLAEVNKLWKDLNVKKKNVLVQVRRGEDYDNKFHGILPMSYYDEAFTHFPDHEFIVFSDDIEWCKRNFIGDQFKFHDNVNPVVDIFVSAKCSNAIIPNSTFSWWSAWFIKNKKKKVIAPKNWFGPRASGTHNTDDLYLEDWILI